MGTVSQRSICSCRAMIFSGSWRHGGMAPMTEVLQWKYMSFMKNRVRRGNCPLCERAVGVCGAQCGEG